MAGEEYHDFLSYLTDPGQNSLRVERTRSPDYICYKCLEPAHGQGRLVSSSDGSRVYFHTSCFQGSLRERAPKHSSFEAASV